MWSSGGKTLEQAAAMAAGAAVVRGCEAAVVLDRVDKGARVVDLPEMAAAAVADVVEPGARRARECVEAARAIVLRSARRRSRWGTAGRHYRL